jgi:beta-lactamase class C
MVRYLLALAALLTATLFMVNGKKAVSKKPARVLAVPAKPVYKKITVTAPPEPAWNELLAGYGHFVQQSLDKQLAPGAAVAIIRDSSIIFLRGFGYRDALSKDPVNEHTVFRLGSVSKCFASVLCGVLVQDKILSWDDPVTKFVPHFALRSQEHTRAVLIRHVLSHTLGLPYHAFTTEVEDNLPLDTMLAHLEHLPLMGEPGQFYSYQNVAYSVISNVIRSATGKAYEEVMKERVFMPLGMQHASLDYQTLLSENNVARPHKKSATRWIPQALSPTYYNVAPAGGVNASIQDVALFLASLTRSNNGLLREDVLDEMFSPYIRATAKNRHFYQWKSPLRSYYGLGWRILRHKDEVINYHGGYVNGFRSEIAIHQNDRVAICVLVNSPGPLADQAIPHFFHMYDKMKRASQVTHASLQP